jgi:hypothetical protein
MNAKKQLLIVAAIVAICVIPTMTQAANGFCGWGGWGNWGYTGYTAEYVPYYAMHPPVYYSYPVPRAYGWSPFAYPPGTMTPEILGKIEPQEMINPHVPQQQPDSPSARPTSNKTTNNEPAGPVPQVVINPYVKDGLAASK